MGREMKGETVRGICARRGCVPELGVRWEGSGWVVVWMGAYCCCTFLLVNAKMPQC